MLVSKGWRETGRRTEGIGGGRGGDGGEGGGSQALLGTCWVSHVPEAYSKCSEASTGLLTCNFTVPDIPQSTPTTRATEGSSVT